MHIQEINEQLLLGEIDSPSLFPQLTRLKEQRFVFNFDFGLEKLPENPGILMIRGPRQYGKSTWMEQQIAETIQAFGPGTAFYLNGDYLPDYEKLYLELNALCQMFPRNLTVKRIFVDEITAVKNWEIAVKRLADAGVLKEILLVTTGSSATDLRRGSERLPGRKGKLARTDYLFTPISYKNFHKACRSTLGKDTLHAYLLSGGSPVACGELAENGSIPEYVIELVRAWIEGEVSRAGRQRTTLVNIFDVLFRFGASPVGQAKLAREANLTNNTVAHGYTEILGDLGCISQAFPYDFEKKNLILRKPCKFPFTNLLVAVAYSQERLRSPENFDQLSTTEQGKWYEWAVAQELQRRAAISGKAILSPLAFWQSKNHEIDFFDVDEGFIEVKRGKASPLSFSWFAKQFGNQKLTVINEKSFSTSTIQGTSLEQFLLSDSKM